MVRSSHDLSLFVRLDELKAEAKAGTGIESHREKQVKAGEERKEQERLEQERLEEEAKDNMSLAGYFTEIYYPAIIQEKKKVSPIPKKSYLGFGSAPPWGKSQ